MPSIQGRLQLELSRSIFQPSNDLVPRQVRHQTYRLHAPPAPDFFVEIVPRDLLRCEWDGVWQTLVLVGMEVNAIMATSADLRGHATRQLALGRLSIMTKAGRPRVLDEAKKREVCALLSAGASLRFAGRYVGCSAKTIRNEAQRDPDFGDRLRKSQLVAQLEPLRALRQKATTHWRAAAWLLERGDPEQFARLDQKFFKPQDVANLLENVRATLQAHIKDFVSQTIASRVISRVMSEAGLPKGRGCAYAKLSELPVGLAPDLIDPFQTSFPASTSVPATRTEEIIDERETTEPEKVNFFSELHDALTEKRRANANHQGKK